MLFTLARLLRVPGPFPELELMHACQSGFYPIQFFGKGDNFMFLWLRVFFILTTSYFLSK